MEYNKNFLPDFYSVRNREQIDYAFEGMDNKKCWIFWNNGFSSNIIEPNKRDIKFIWDGFILFTDKSISLDDMKRGINLYDERLVGLQRMSTSHEKANDEETHRYILNKLQEKGIPYEEMPDTKDVDGYASKCDLWSTRDESVLVDAMDCTGDGQAFYFKDAVFDYRIAFNISGIPEMHYHHEGALVLRGENETAISRLIENDANLKNYLEGIIGENRIQSYIEKKDLPGKSITDIKK